MTKSRFTLSEDWIATIAGLAIVLIIGAGLFGPGPHSASLTAQPGAFESAEVAPLSGWQVSAALAGAALEVDLAPYSELEAGERYAYSCREGTLSPDTALEVPDAIDAPSSDRAQIVLYNGCTDTATLRYKIDYAIRWPLFGLWGNT